MKDFADSLMNAIIAEELPKINKIMAHMAEETRKDLYNKTLILLDTYYDGYKRPPRKYVRIDESKAFKPRNKKGQFVSKNRKSGRDSYFGKSLKQAIYDGESSISFATGGINGYSAGIEFDEDYFESDNVMNHPKAGIEEFDIVENFLFSDTDGIGQHPKMMRTPEAAGWLYRYLDNYDTQMDKYYQDACKKYR